MNPITTDSEMYRVKSPNLKTAIRIWIVPTIIARRKVASYAPRPEPVARKASCAEDH